MTFSKLKIGDHFEFAHKTEIRREIFNLVGIKKDKLCYRMGGINRIIGNKKIKVIKTSKELN